MPAKRLIVGIYEATFILDNREVKKGWARTKTQVTGIMEKHGAKVLSARKWDDRKLAYPIKKQKRGTYLLSYIEAEGPMLISMRNEFHLTDYVLRHMILQSEEVPADEVDLSAQERERDKEEIVAEEAESAEDSGVVASVGERTAAEAPAEAEAGDGDGDGSDKEEGEAAEESKGEEPKGEEVKSE